MVVPLTLAYVALLRDVLGVAVVFPPKRTASATDLGPVKLWVAPAMLKQSPGFSLTPARGAGDACMAVAGCAVRPPRGIYFTAIHNHRSDGWWSRSWR